MTRAEDRGVARIGGDLVHQAQRHRLVRRHAASAGDHVERDQRSGQSRRALRAAGARDQADAHFRKADGAIRRDNARVADQREFVAAAERGAVDRRDDRLATGVERVQHGADRWPWQSVIEFADIRAGDEGASLAGDDRGAQARIGGKFGECRDQTLAHGKRQGVHRWMIDDDQAHIA